MIPRTRVLLLALALALLPVAPSAGHRAKTARSEKLAHAVAGRPLVVGERIFFVRHDASGATVIAGYDGRSGSTFELKRGRFEVRALATDGRLLAWIERQATARVQLMQLDTRSERTVLRGPQAEHIAELALAGGTLVYAAHGAQARGIFAFDPVTHNLRRLANGGSGLLAGGGNVLWNTAHDAGGATEWHLLLDRLDGGAPALLARSPAPFSGYDVAADAVVWSALPPAVERRVWLHRISDGSSAPISVDPGRFPRLGAGGAVWAVEAGGPGPAIGPAALERYDLGDGRRSRLRFGQPGLLAAWGTLGDGRVVWTDEQAAGDGRALWLSVLPPGGAVPATGTADDAMVHASRSPCGTPLTCGQLRAGGQFLYDAGGRWDARGVQFFLPQFGINTFTFYDRNYWPHVDEVERWLNVARNGLRARLLRIFVELPEGEWQPTAHETVYDFAQRAGAYGMRVGIVVQNSADFAMTPERRAWLDGLVAYFEQRGAKPLIAYISAANEINNWCARQDCFDRDAAYRDAAINWTAEVAATIKARDPTLLVTVGLSSEVNDSDGVPAVYGFFKRDAKGRSLAGVVDFLAPHNYAGGAYGVYNDLRYTYAYPGPIMLEEFGWTTDPQGDDPRFTEGDPACALDPWTVSCQNTGPYFVEWSLRAMREVPYAGGVAWMLADVARKDCASDPSDLWSGLFASGDGYCGGTRSVAPAQGKATAYRVAVFYGADDLSRMLFMPVIGTGR